MYSGIWFSHFTHPFSLISLFSVFLSQGDVPFTTQKIEYRKLGYGPPIPLAPHDVLQLNKSKPFTTSRKVVLLTTTNAAFIDFTDNWLASIRRIGPLPFTTIVAEDDIAYDHLLNISDVNAIRAGTNSPTTFLMYGTDEYKKMVGKRTRYILEYLSNGYDVIFNDVDSVWLQDPFPYLDTKYDVCAQPVRYLLSKYICAGFTYYKSANKTIQLVKKWIEIMTQSNYTLKENVLLNKIIDERMVKNLTVKHLDANKFFSGLYYFDDNWRRTHTELDPVMIHNTFVKGHDIKVDRFKRLGLWYINYTIPEKPNVHQEIGSIILYSYNELSGIL